MATKSPKQKGYERGFRDGSLRGFEYMLTCCYCRLPDMGLTQDEIYKIHMAMNEETEKIRRLGEDYYRNRKEYLAKEYGIRFHFREDTPLNRPIAPKTKPDFTAFCREVRLGTKNYYQP